MELLTIVEEIRNSTNMPQIIEELLQVQVTENQKRKEFYELVHENMKAEFINGEIIFQSPVKRGHWKVSTRLSSRMSLYADTHHLGEVGIEKVMIRCNRNDYEPDICFFNNEKSQLFTNDQLLFPAPDLAVEIISASTEKIDRTIKFTDYALQGISEYWIIDPEKQTFEQYILPPNKNTYTLQSKLTQKGIIHAVVIQGFQIDIAELFV